MCNSYLFECHNECILINTIPVHMHMKQSKLYNLCFSAAGMNMVAYIHPPKKLSETSENCKLAPIPFVVCGKRLVFLNFITITQCNWWAMIRTMYSPLPKCCKDELYFLTLFQPFGFYGSGTWQEKCKGSTTLPSALQDAELPFDL